jgi:hypothetical protein
LPVSLPPYGRIGRYSGCGIRISTDPPSDAAAAIDDDDHAKIPGGELLKSGTPASLDMLG